MFSVIALCAAVNVVFYSVCLFSLQLSQMLHSRCTDKGHISIGFIKWTVFYVCFFFLRCGLRRQRPWSLISFSYLLYVCFLRWLWLSQSKAKKERMFSCVLMNCLHTCPQHCFHPKLSITCWWLWVPDRAIPPSEYICRQHKKDTIHAFDLVISRVNCQNI